MTEVSSRLLVVIALLAITGISVSSVSLAHHYGTSKTAYCDFGETFNCDVVNRSVYSTILGIPVALIGMIGYLTLLLCATLYSKQRHAGSILLFGSSAGLVFALYLTYIEGFVLNAWCILCLSSLAIILLIATLSSVVFLRTRHAS